MSGAPPGRLRILGTTLAVWPCLTVLALLVIAYAQAGLARDGWMIDADDFFRLQQVRDLLAGQDWFDVSQSRFDTPEGGAMHWSRLPDLPLAGLILLLSPVIGPEAAERFAVFWWPMALYAVSLGLVATILARVKAGDVGIVAGLVFFAAGGAAFQFWPGRIDHHGLSLVLGLAALTALLSPRRSAASAMVAGLCVCAMISIAIESLPMAATIVAGFGLAWLVRGQEERTRLRAFGATLVAGALLAFVADAPGASAAREACDAYGTAHLAGLFTGGTLLSLLAVFTSRFADWRQRILAAGLAGAVTLAAVFLVGPGCFQSPLALVSEMARTSWLDGVPEARGVLSVFAEQTPYAVFVYATALVCLLAGIAVLRSVPDGRRLDTGILVLALFVSLAVALWQVRGVLFAHPAASLMAGLAIGQLNAYGRAANPVRAILVSALGFVLFWPITWSTLGSALPARATAQHATNGMPMSVACLDPALYGPLGALPAARVMTPIDLGPAVIARSPHTIFAAPYHRNIGAIERAAAFWSSPSGEAEDVLRAVRADFVVICPGLGELARHAARSPEGLAANLLAGKVPEWLAPELETGQGPARLVVYRVRSPDETDSSRTVR